MQTSLDSLFALVIVTAACGPRFEVAADVPGDAGRDDPASSGTETAQTLGPEGGVRSVDVEVTHVPPLPATLDSGDVQPTSPSGGEAPDAGREDGGDDAARESAVDERTDACARTPNVCGPTCSFEVKSNSYNGPQWWGTVVVKNNGPVSSSNYSVEFNIPPGRH